MDVSRLVVNFYLNTGSWYLFQKMGVSKVLLKCSSQEEFEIHLAAMNLELCNRHEVCHENYVRYDVRENENT